MATRKAKRTTKTDSSSGEQVCFVISPIGKDGSEIYEKFKEVLDYVIKPAVESSSLKLKVIRADDINHAGSFIKDIFENILGSHVVIADLTGQNPNVFYELGVRHALSPRTIMIAQTLEDVPSDLREYRTITYSTTAKGSKLFQERLHKFLEDIMNEPLRPDNPILDRLPTFQENKTESLEAEVSKLKEELNSVLEGSIKKPILVSKDTVKNRFKRICTLMHGHLQQHGNFQKTVNEEKVSFQLPKSEGNFNLYITMIEASEYIDEYWYVSICDVECNLEKDLADIRLLLAACSAGQKVGIKFIIITDEDLLSLKPKITKAFVQMKKFIPADQRAYFDLLLWDHTGLMKKETELGIRVNFV
ncbi:hypothetical protein [Geomonas edaphica]|uniref:hypothetical protein n=1 Tax=Geomonas edaphica TaxID=2570226 RepID=UPI0010A77A97|nr:hypothetical protein [Geomonas edaphica]